MHPFNARLNPDWVRVAGDIHGNADALAQVVRRASADGIGLLLAGDLVNNGPASPEVARLVLEGIEGGLIDFVPGNHDVLVARLLSRPAGPDETPTVARTRAQFDAHPDGRALARAFVRAVSGRGTWRRLGHHVVAHAGFDPRMLWRPPAALNDPDPTARALAQRAVWGERGRARNGGKPPISYGWTRTVPPGIKVVIGHDTVATDRIVRRTTINGGRVIHIDCGLGHGGRLATLDINRHQSPAPPRPTLRITVETPDDTRLAALARAHADTIVVDGRSDIEAARARARAHLAEGSEVLLAGDHTSPTARLASAALQPPEANIVYLDAPGDMTADALGNVTLARSANWA